MATAYRLTDKTEAKAKAGVNISGVGGTNVDFGIRNDTSDEAVNPLPPYSEG